MECKLYMVKSLAETAVVAREKQKRRRAPPPPGTCLSSKLLRMQRLPNDISFRPFLLNESQIS